MCSMKTATPACMYTFEQCKRWQLARMLACRAGKDNMGHCSRMLTQLFRLRVSNTGSGAAMQELTSILEVLESQRADMAGTPPDNDNKAAPAPEEAEHAGSEPHSAGAAAKGEDGGALEAGVPDAERAAGEPDQAGARQPGLLQTFVFSATLTLPQKLRKRLRKGMLRDSILQQVFVPTNLATSPTVLSLVRGCAHDASHLCR